MLHLLNMRYTYTYTHIALHSDIKHVTSCEASKSIAFCILQLVKLCIESTINAQYVPYGQDTHYAQYSQHNLRYIAHISLL